MLFTVSIRVSPFLTELCAALKLITSALNRFSASSKDSFVLVEFEKQVGDRNISPSEGTFMGRLMTAADLLLFCESIQYHSVVRYLIPNK
jgi:hypothetical protein